ncbi:MAG: DUF5723 family protein [Candidatus Kapabacteria bacterium]|nr:DUF5723 family protein [Candidatus Kapabacteria bacterium]
MRFYILLFSFALISNCFAQNGTTGSLDARSLGMSETGSASTHGVLCIGKNPALLSKNRDSVKSMEVLLPSFSARFYTNSLTMKNINDFFGKTDSAGHLLTEADKTNFLNAFKNDGKISINVVPIHFGIVYTPSDLIGSFGLAVIDNVSQNITIPQPLVDLALNGNEVNKTYNFTDFGFKFSYTRSYSLTYSRLLFDNFGPFQKFHIGVTAKYLQGYAYTDVSVQEAYLHTDDMHVLTGKIIAKSKGAFSRSFNVVYDFDTVNKGSGSNFSILPQPAGSGFGFDIGSAFSLGSMFSFGVSITDIGSITWDKYNAEYTTTGNFRIDDLLDKKQMDTLQHLLKSKGEFTGSFTSYSPTALHISASIHINKKIPGDLIAEVQYSQGFNNTSSNSINPRLSFGAEWLPGQYLPILLLGTNFDPSGTTRISGGIGFHSPLADVYLATGDIPSLLSGAQASSLSVGLSVVWKPF